MVSTPLPRVTTFLTVFLTADPERPEFFES